MKASRTATVRHMLLTGTVAALASVVALPGGAQAQQKTCSVLEVISHASPGGGTDTTARMMMIRSRRELSDYTNDIVVVYKRGGAAAASHEYLKQRPADGCTVLAITQTHMYTIARGKSAIEMDDIVGVARAMDDPTFLVVGKDSPNKTVEDLIEQSKERPLNWGVAQVGGTEHIGLIRFSKAVGIPYKVVPFGSAGEMMNALLSGAIDATLPNVSEAVGQIADGQVRPLLVLNDKRLGDYPDIASSYEKGWEVKVSTTRGYGVKKGTPPEAIKALEEAMVKAMKHDTFANYLKSSGLNPEDSVTGHDVWDKQLKEEYAIAKDAIENLGLGQN